MKIRSLIAAAVVLIALLGTLYWSSHRKTSEDATKSADVAPLILKLDENSINRVEWKRKDSTPVVLSKSNAGAWEITEPKKFAVDQSTATSTVSSLASLNSQRLVEDHAADLKQYGLEHPALAVDVTEKDNQTQKLLLGDETPTGSAIYAMLSGDSRVFTVPSYTKTGIDKSLNDLRDKRLITIDSSKISRLELVRKNETIEFGRNKDDWQILKPKPLRADNFQVAELVRKLTSGTQDLQIRKNKDAYFAKSSVVEGAYKVDADLGKAVDKGLDEYREKKLFDFGYNDPSKIENHNGPKTYFLTRDGADWWSSGKKMDAASVEEFVGKLRDLAASKFVESGFASPTMQLSVTSEDGKRVDNVSIAKSGEGYIGKREGEPTLYYLDSSSIDALQKSADDIKPFAAPVK